MRDIIICDDERVWREFLVKDINKWAAETNHEFSFTEFSKSSELIEYANNAHPMDAVFLDIELGDEISGIEAAKQLRNMGCTVPIVFVSGHPILASEGYKVDAVDFLVKKYRYDQLAFCLKKVAKIATPAESRTIIVENVERMSRRLLMDDIVYAEALDREVILHIRNNGTIRTRKTLANLLSELEVDTFLQVHRSYIVSIKHIVGFKMTYPYYLYVSKDDNKDPKDISVGRSFFQKVQNVYAQTITENMI